MVNTLLAPVTPDPVIASREANTDVPDANFTLTKLPTFDAHSAADPSPQTGDGKTHVNAPMCPAAPVAGCHVPLSPFDQVGVVVQRST